MTPPAVPHGTSRTSSVCRVTWTCRVSSRKGMRTLNPGSARRGAGGPRRARQSRAASVGRLAVAAKKSRVPLTCQCVEQRPASIRDSHVALVDGVGTHHDYLRAREAWHAGEEGARGDGGAAAGSLSGNAHHTWPPMHQRQALVGKRAARGAHHDQQRHWHHGKRAEHCPSRRRDWRECSGVFSGSAGRAPTRP